MTPVRESAMQLSRQTYVSYTVQLKSGTTLEDALKPEFWVHLGHKLRPCDQLELLPEDMSFYAKVIVKDAGRLWANVALLQVVDLDPIGTISQEPMLDEYDVQWSGPHDKFRVIRKSDKTVMAKGFKSKDTAFEHLRNLSPKAA